MVGSNRKIPKAEIHELAKTTEKFAGVGYIQEQKQQSFTLSQNQGYSSKPVEPLKNGITGE